MRKLILSTLILLVGISTNCFGQYDSYKRNPDGTYVLGGCYDSYKRNPDGTYVCGGAYDSYKRNPDGTYVVGWGPCRN